MRTFFRKITKPATEIRFTPARSLGNMERDLTFLYAELRGAVVFAHEKRMWDMTVLLELFLEVYGAFSQEELPTEAELKGILCSYINDYCRI